MKSTIFCATLLLCTGCAANFALPPQYPATKGVFTPTAPASVERARPSTCDFVVLTMQPNRPFDEVGIVEFTQAELMWRPIHNVQVFREQVRDAVCNAGGDAIIAQINGMGIYVQGTVITWRADDEAN